MQETRSRDQRARQARPLVQRARRDRPRRRRRVPIRASPAQPPPPRRPRRRLRPPSAPASEAPASAAAESVQDRLHLARRLGAVRQARLGRHQGSRRRPPARSSLFCDSEIDAAKALACAQNLKVQGAEGVLNFQVFQDSSPEICTAYGSVPTIAIDIIQPPCQIAFMGANNHEAGRLGGAKLGKYAKANWDCDITAYVSLESTAAGAANTDRMGGWRDGFKESCPIPTDKEHILDGADRTDPALEQMTNLLGALPGQPASSSWPSTRTASSAPSAPPTRSVARPTCGTAARAPIPPSGRTSPATRTTSRRWRTSPSATAPCSSRT